MRFHPSMLLLVLACGADEPAVEPAPVSEGGETEVAAAPDEPAPILTADVSELVLAQSMFEGWTIVPLAQLEREDRVVVVVWPSIAPNGQVVDDDIIGLTLRRTADGLEVVESNWGMRGSGIAEHLGGEPTSRDRGEGVAADELGPKLSELPRRFAEHVQHGEREAAVEVAVEFSRLWAFEHAVESDTVSELLAHHTRNARIETEPGDAPGRVRVRFFQGDDMVEEEMLIAQEQQPGRWVFTDHARVSAGVR